MPQKRGAESIGTKVEAEKRPFRELDCAEIMRFYSRRHPFSSLMTMIYVALMSLGLKFLAYPFTFYQHILFSVLSLVFIHDSSSCTETNVYLHVLYILNYLLLMRFSI